MPLGGHINPYSTVGAIALSKNAQKNLIKKKISDKMNNSIAIRKENSSLCLWKPVIDSRTKSLNHIKSTITGLKKIISLPKKFTFIKKILTKFTTVKKAESLTNSGHRELCIPLLGDIKLTVLIYNLLMEMGINL